MSRFCVKRFPTWSTTVQALCYVAKKIIIVMGKYIGIQPFNPWLRRACVYVDNTHVLVPDSKNESPFSDGTKNYLVESILWTKTLKQFICHRILAIGVFHCTRPGSGQRCITIITLTCLADIVFWQRSSKIQSFEILQIPEACIYNMNVGHISLLFFVFTCNFQRQIEPGIECLKDPSPPPHGQNYKMIFGTEALP